MYSKVSPKLWQQFQLASKAASPSLTSYWRLREHSYPFRIAFFGSQGSEMVWEKEFLKLGCQCSKAGCEFCSALHLTLFSCSATSKASGFALFPGQQQILVSFLCFILAPGLLFCSVGDGFLKCWLLCPWPSPWMGTRAGSVLGDSAQPLRKLLPENCSDTKSVTFLFPSTNWVTRGDLTWALHFIHLWWVFHFQIPPEKEQREWRGVRGSETKKISKPALR